MKKGNKTDGMTTLAVEIDGQSITCLEVSGGEAIGDSDFDGYAPLRLQLAVTDGDNTVGNIASAVANQGKNERRTITITEMAKDKVVLKTHVYSQSMLMGLDFPSASSRGKPELLVETATFLPLRRKTNEPAIKAGSDAVDDATKNVV